MSHAACLQENVSSGAKFKEAREAERKSQAGNRAAWNTLFMRSDTVAEAVAAHYGISKSQLLSKEAADLPVRMALGEAHVIAMTKRALGDAGGWLAFVANILEVLTVLHLRLGHTCMVTSVFVHKPQTAPPPPPSPPTPSCPVPSSLFSSINFVSLSSSFWLRLASLPPTPPPLSPPLPSQPSPVPLFLKTTMHWKSLDQISKQRLFQSCCSARWHWHKQVTRTCD